MQRVEAPNDVYPRELSSEQEEGDPRANNGNGVDHSVNNAKSIARQQVIRQGVAGEAFGHRQNEQHKTNSPVQLTRLAECAGEEHAEHVQADSGNEEERSPVVHLTHEQPATNIERNVQR